MKRSEYFAPYEWDDCAAMDDLLAVAERTTAWVRAHGKVGLELVPAQLARQLLDYVCLRGRGASWSDLDGPRYTRSLPVGWTAHHERLWNDWIHYSFAIEDWRRQVLDPVFGTDERSWEVGCAGWRDEVFAFLPRWIVRDMVRFVEIDATPLPEPEPEDTDPRLAKIDPYLVEHARRGRRIKGMRTFE
jgi:hypothetical protein